MRYWSSLLPLVVFSSGMPLLVGQTAPPNGAGISMGHIHLVVPDPASMQKVWVDVMGGTPETAGPLTMVKFPNVFVIITGGANAAGREGTNGSVVNHVGFSVKSYAQTRAKAEAAGLAVRELTPGQQAFLTFPNNVTVEIQEDPSITSQSEFSHFHLQVPDPNAARAWYIKTFGGEEGERRKGLKGAKLPGGFVDFLGPEAAADAARTAQRQHLCLHLHHQKAAYSTTLASKSKTSKPSLSASRLRARNSMFRTRTPPPVWA